MLWGGGGAEAPGTLGWEAAVASEDASAAAEARAAAAVRSWAEAAELAEVKPRTSSGSQSPSWTEDQVSGRDLSLFSAHQEIGHN